MLGRKPGLREHLQPATMHTLLQEIGTDCAKLCRNEYLAMGLYHIAKAVGFLNNDCQLVHVWTACSRLILQSLCFCLDLLGPEELVMLTTWA